MNKLASCFFVVWVLVVPLTAVAQQTCRSESEVPSSIQSSRFSDHGNGTVTDNATGLVWSKCAAGLSGEACSHGAGGTYTWQNALDFAAASGLAGFSDWRLPNIKELSSIAEQRCSSPAINGSVFPNTPSSNFWSASAVAARSDNAWSVNFYNGSSGSSYRDNSNYVRLVRAGQ